MARTNLYLSGVTPNSGGFYDPNNPSGSDVPSPTNTPQLTNPDWVLSEDFSGVKDISIFNKDAFTTWGATDNTGLGGTNLVARYSTDGIQSDGSAWSEQEISMPINAVQIILKFKEFTPASYNSSQAYNHKTVGFWSGPYGTSAANISITSECWPASDGSSPSLNPGIDGANYGHLMTAGRPLLWINGDGKWHDVCAVLELAASQGAYGRYRIYRDNIRIVDTDPNGGMESSFTGDAAQEIIKYATRGNFIDTVRLFGWCNASGSEPAFSGDMKFLYRDLEITANETFKTMVEPV